MTDGNLFPEISSTPLPEFNPDALSPDPDTVASPSNPEPLPPLNLPQAEVAPPVFPEPMDPILVDGSLPPNLPPDDFAALSPAPQGKRRSDFWLWAAPALLLIVIMFAVGVRAFIMGGIANVSLDVVRPKSGENVFLNQPVTVVARIRSSNGWSKANFYVNNQLMQSIPGAEANYDQELNFTWTPSSEGATMLRVLVTNKKGDQTATEDVALMVVRGESGATITSLPAASATITLTPTKGPNPTPCTDLFEIVAESGLVQGTKMDVGRPFTKSWTLKNVGSCKWEKYKFVFVSGSLLGSTTPLPVPITETGGTATLNLNLVSPSIAGNFIGKWRVQNSRGDLFGPELVYGLVVPSPTPTITPTKTDTPTPRPSSTPRFTATATTTPVTPTATPVTPTAIIAPVIPTATPVPEPTPYTYSNDFSDINIKPSFPIGSTDYSTYGYMDDGTYAIVTNSYLQPIVPTDYLGTGDARIEVDVWQNTSSDAGSFGIVCGFVDYENYFTIGIGTDGSVGVYQKIKDKNVSTLLYKESQFTPVDPLGVYHLIANCQTGRFTLDVNGTNVIDLKDSDLTDPVLTSNGGVGIYGSSLKNGSFKFDNFKVYQPDQIATILFRDLLSAPLLPVGIRLPNANPKNQKK